MSQPKSMIWIATTLATMLATILTTSACESTADDTADKTAAAAVAEKTEVEAAAEAAKKTETQGAAAEAAKRTETQGAAAVEREAAAEVNVDGSLDKAQIQGVIRAHVPEIRKCYNELLAENPRAAGRVLISFEIGEDGNVGESSVAEDAISPRVAECIRAQVQTWIFPKPQGGPVRVNYPFLLEPG